MVFAILMATATLPFYAFAQGGKHPPPPQGGKHPPPPSIIGDIEAVTGAMLPEVLPIQVRD